MNKIKVFILLVSTISFSQESDIKSINDSLVNSIIINAETEIKNNEIKTQKKIDRNWFVGSSHFISGIDENLPIGFRLNRNGFYFDIRSNFGAWGNKEKPNGEEGFYVPANDGYTTNLNYTDFDNSSSATLLNIGYSFKTLKTPNFVLSVFLGGGVALVSSAEYQSYSGEYTPMGAMFISSFDYYEVDKNSSTIINANIGLEFAFKKTSIVIGVDTYSLDYDDDSIAGFIGIGKSL
jgi:hypothetical protein